MKSSILLTVAACVLFAPAALAHEFNVVQHHEPEINAAHSVQAFAPVGQEFVSTFSLLDVVELHLQESSGTGSVNVQVRLRLDAPDGTILGESNVLTIPPMTFGIAHFDFAEPIAITPGTRYVIELARVGGLGNAMISSGSETHYDNGRSFLSGAFGFGNDFWFRTGLSTTVPVVRQSWGSLKSGGR